MTAARPSPALIAAYPRRRSSTGHVRARPAMPPARHCAPRSLMSRITNDTEKRPIVPATRRRRHRPASHRIAITRCAAAKSP